MSLFFLCLQVVDDFDFSPREYALSSDSLSTRRELMIFLSRGKSSELFVIFI